MTRRGRRAKSGPAGRAIGWWIAGFEERMYPERETVAERVRWGSETRVASGQDGDVVVRFPDDPAGEPGAGEPEAPQAVPSEAPSAGAAEPEADRPPPAGTDEAGARR